MNLSDSTTLLRVFLRVLRVRGYIAAVFLILTAAGIYGATRVPNDSAIERLVVAGDPVVRATLDFEHLFPDGEHALLMLEAPDPLSPAALRAALQLEHALAGIPHVEPHSLLDFFPRTASISDWSPAEAAKVRVFATGTPLFRRAGLLGDHYFGIALSRQSTRLLCR
jgi:predicted RND superfamily exporter protein